MTYNVISLIQIATYVYGVIRPIDTEVNLKELEEVINDESTAVAIKTDRFKKKDYTTGKWIGSQCIKIKFKGTELPEKVRICRMFFKVRPFFPDVLQCYSCQRIGYTANSCSSSSIALSAPKETDDMERAWDGVDARPSTCNVMCVSTGPPPPSGN